MSTKILFGYSALRASSFFPSSERAEISKKKKKINRDLDLCQTFSRGRDPAEWTCPWKVRMFLTENVPCYLQKLWFWCVQL